MGVRDPIWTVSLACKVGGRQHQVTRPSSMCWLEGTAVFPWVLKKIIQKLGYCC